jgi:hypothetical protein
MEELDKINPASNTTDNPGNTGNDAQQPKQSKRGNKPSQIPQMLYVSSQASPKYRESGWISAILSPDDFDLLVENMKAASEEKSENKSSRSPIGLSLQDLNNEINQSTENLKGAIVHKVGRAQAPYHFGKYAIEKISKNYKLPFAREKRLIALDKLINELAKGELQTEEFGVEYWTEKRDMFRSLMDDTGKKVGTISLKVSAISEYKKKMYDAFNIMIYLIKANTRKEDVQATLRDWGFQRERY